MIINKNNQNLSPAEHQTDTPIYALLIVPLSFMVCLDKPYLNRHKQISYPVKVISFNKALTLKLEGFVFYANQNNVTLRYLFVFSNHAPFPVSYPGNIYWDLNYFIHMNVLQFIDWIENNEHDIKNFVIIFNDFASWSDVMSTVFSWGRIHLEGSDSSVRHVFSHLCLRFSRHLSLLSKNNLNLFESLIVKDKPRFKPKMNMVNLDAWVLKQEENGLPVFIDNVLKTLKDSVIDMDKWRKDYTSLSSDIYKVQFKPLIDYSSNSVNQTSNSTDLNLNHSEEKKLIPSEQTKPSTNSNLSKNVSSTQNIKSFNNKRNFHIFSYSFTHSKRSYHFKSISQQRLNVYSEFALVIKNNPINEETQMKLENYLLSHEYANFNPNKTISGINTGYFNNTLAEYFFNYKELLKIKIEKFLSNKPDYESNSPKKILVLLIEVIGFEFVLGVILGRFLRIVTNQKLNVGESKNICVDIMHDITEDFIREYSYLLYKKEKKINNSYTLSDWKQENKSLVKTLNEIDTKISIGGIIIEWMIDTDLLRKTYVYTTDKKINNLFIPSVQAVKDISNLEIMSSSAKSEEKLKLKQFFYSLPLRLPMICKPKLYTRDSNGKYNLGGYLLNDIKYTNHIILDNPYFKVKSVIKQKNLILDLVNNINSVAYKINTNVLDFITTYPNYFDKELLDPDFEHPLSKLTQLNKNDRNELTKYYSKIDLQQNILNIAYVYSQLPEFYLVVRLDSRGRLYCISEYLNYQSTELAKSLLLFSKPNFVSKTNITAINYLKAYGANCFGNKIDKLSYNNKINWVDNNVLKIKNFADGELIKQSDNKFLFTAFCFEFNRWLDFYNDPNQEYFNSFLPIQLDATCNGYQHLALLSLDSNLSEQLNLTESTFNDKPKDFYTFLLIKLLQYFKDKLDETTLDVASRSIYERLYNFNFQRNVIKKCIMTIPYNATNPRLIEYFISNFKKWTDEDKNVWYSIDSEMKLSYEDISVFIKAIRHVLNKNFDQLSSLIKYLKQVADICTKLQIPIPWSLPSGLKVSQSYLKVKSVQLMPFTYSKTKFSVNTYLSEYDKNKQIRAFMPNLIHSLDATTLAMLVTDYFKSDFSSKNIFTIHDCFGININHIEYIIDLLKVCYIKLYSEDKYLLTLHNEVIRNIVLVFGSDSYNENTRIIKTDSMTLEFPDIKNVLKENTEFNFDSLKNSVYPLV